jgi:L-alanine-DL-glutamate epimerase-like enolase superfamily enzyme
VESTLGIAAALQLAPLVDHLDLDGALLLAHDPFTGPGMNDDGTLRFNHDPGLGVARR